LIKIVSDELDDLSDYIDKIFNFKPKAYQPQFETPSFKAPREIPVQEPFSPQNTTLALPRPTKRISPEPYTLDDLYHRTAADEPISLVKETKPMHLIKRQHKMPPYY
jgi:hypothetical protein